MLSTANICLTAVIKSQKAGFMHENCPSGFSYFKKSVFQNSLRIFPVLYGVCVAALHWRSNPTEQSMLCEIIGKLSFVKMSFKAMWNWLVAFYLLLSSPIV